MSENKKNIAPGKQEKFTRRCRLCRKAGRDGMMAWFQISLDSTLLVCNNKECMFPFFTPGVPSCAMKRKFTDLASTGPRKKRRKTKVEPPVENGSSSMLTETSQCAKPKNVTDIGPVSSLNLANVNITNQSNVNKASEEPKPSGNTPSTTIHTANGPSLSSETFTTDLNTYIAQPEPMELEVKAFEALSLTPESMEPDVKALEALSLTAGPSSSESNHTTVSIPSEAELKWSSFSKFPLWRNKDNLCWLDACLPLLIFNKKILCASQHSNFDHNTLKSICRLYWITLGCTNDKSAGANDAVVQGQLESIREMAIGSLACEKGKEDSPLFAILALLHGGKETKRLFEVSYKWTMICQVCQNQSLTSSKRLIPSFGPVSSDFRCTNGYVLNSCCFCNAPDQKHCFQIESIQDCMILHFASGVCDSNIPAYDFVHNNQLFAVTGIVQYQRDIRHFVTWIREPKGNLWLCCDDLQAFFPSFSSNSPNVNPSEIYLIMWERQGHPGANGPSHLPLDVPSEENKNGSSLVQPLLLVGGSSVPVQMPSCDSSDNHRVNLPAFEAVKPSPVVTISNESEQSNQESDSSLLQSQKGCGLSNATSVQISVPESLNISISDQKSAPKTQMDPNHFIVNFTPMSLPVNANLQATNGKTISNNQEPGRVLQNAPQVILSMPSAPSKPSLLLSFVGNGQQSCQPTYLSLPSSPSCLSSSNSGCPSPTPALQNNIPAASSSSRSRPKRKKSTEPMKTEVGSIPVNNSQSVSAGAISLLSRFGKRSDFQSLVKQAAIANAPPPISNAQNLSKQQQPSSQSRSRRKQPEVVSKPFQFGSLTFDVSEMNFSGKRDPSKANEKYFVDIDKRTLLAVKDVGKNDVKPRKQYQRRNTRDKTSEPPRAARQKRGTRSSNTTKLGETAISSSLSSNKSHGLLLNTKQPYRPNMRSDRSDGEMTVRTSTSESSTDQGASSSAFSVNSSSSSQCRETKQEALVRKIKEMLKLKSLSTGFEGYKPRWLREQASQENTTKKEASEQKGKKGRPPRKPRSQTTTRNESKSNKAKQECSEDKENPKTGELVITAQAPNTNVASPSPETPSQNHDGSNLSYDNDLQEMLEQLGQNYDLMEQPDVDFLQELGLY